MKVKYPPKNDLIYTTGISVSTFCFFLAICLFFFRPVILSKFILPLSEVFLSSDGIIEKSTMDYVNNILIMTGPILAFTSLFPLSYAMTWRYFSFRLPKSKSTIAESYSKPISNLEIFLILATIFVAFVFRFNSIGRGFSYDEIFTAMHFVEVDSTWETISSYIVFNNHIAYSIFSRLSFLLFGRHEWALRLPALLFGLGSIFYLWKFGRKLLNAKLVIIATFLLSVHPAHVLYSVSARGYSGMIFFTLLSTNYYIELLPLPTIRKAILFIITSTIAIYFHLYSSLVIIVQILFFLYLAIKQIIFNNSNIILNFKSFRTLWLSFAAIVLFSICLYAPVLKQLISLIIASDQGTLQLLFPFKTIAYLSGSVGIIIGLSFFIITLIGLASKHEAYPIVISYFCWLFIIPMFMVWLSRPFYLYSRFFLYFIPYYIVLYVMGLSSLWQLSITWYSKISNYFFRAISIVSVVTVLSFWAYNSLTNIPEESFRQAAKAMQEKVEQSAALCAIGGGAKLFQYYSDSKIFVPKSFEKFLEIIEEFEEIRCAYRKRPWEPEHHTKIAELLSENAISQQHRNVIVYIYRKKK